ncbi:hypothetical protein JTB14_007659 [Gonioctena quinquepunctata]|nr:hypothetical protein JTB14_007659 [Gonioctena quinquepunctata]
MKAFGRGNIDVEMHVGGKWVQNYLQDVWFVPEAKKNLLSIHSIVDKGKELYAKKMLRKFNMYDSSPVGTPIEKCQINEGFEDEGEISPNIPFRSAVGSLMYLSIVTRPDITFAVHFASQAVSKPRYHHWEIVKRILKSIRGTLDYGIVYQPGECSLQAFSDSNYAGDLSTRKSTS